VSAQPDRTALLGELAQVLQSPEFVRSPVLRRLLEYLVGQTLEGNGSRLKAYQIAVEGLGRDDSFDPQSDSYPRVQVGRLRKMLDLHYAALTPEQAQDRLRISIPVGHYNVELQPIALPPAAASEDSQPPTGIAPARAPDAAGEIPGAGQILPHDAAPHADSPPPLAYAPPVQPGWGDRGWLIWAVPTLLLLAALYGVWLVARPGVGARDAAQRDMRQHVAHVTISTQPGGDNDDLNTVAQIAEMQLQRFEMLAVSMGTHEDADGTRETAREYELVLRGGVRQQSALPQILFLTLRHVATGTTLWSYELPRNGSALTAPDFEQAIGAGISALARSGGLIVQHQRKLIGSDMSPGYPCLIQYDAFRQRRDPALRPALESCLTRSLEAFPDEPLFLQALSYMALSSPQPGKQTPLVPSRRGRAMAEAALQFDGRSSLAQIAVARSALARGNCPRAIAFARRAVESNPLEPDTLGLAGTFLLSCGDMPGAEQVLERAMAMNSEPGGYQTASLVIARLINGKSEAALELALRADSSDMASQPNFLLAKALALAANGRMDRARASWAALEKAVGVAPGTPADEILGRFAISPFFSRRMVAEAERTGLISPGA
jgi:tetratricopeptide (TPR) repeat protein